jgi:hypothetical protein
MQKIQKAHLVLLQAFGWVRCYFFQEERKEMQERKKDTKSSGELLVHYHHIPDARIIQCDVVVDTDLVLLFLVMCGPPPGSQI